MFCAVFHNFLIKLHCVNHAGKQCQTSLYSVNGIKGKFLVFLHIFVVSKRNSLHCCQHWNQSTVYTTGFSADKFGDVRILFLWHDTWTGGIRIINFNKTVFVWIPQNDFFTETAHMHHNRRESTEQFNEVITVGNRIHTVKGRTVKLQKRSGVLAVQRIGCSGESTGTEWTVIHTVIDVAQAASVAAEHFKISPEMVSKCHRLSFLQMGKARHKSINIFWHDPVNYHHQFLEQIIDFNDFISCV